MTKDEQFFYDHAGFSYDPATETAEQGHQRTARNLAGAERWARANGYELVVEDEPNYASAADEQVERIEAGESVYVGARLVSAEGTTVAALGGIEVEGYDDPYLRAVGAELADEARYELSEQVRAALA